MDLSRTGCPWTRHELYLLYILYPTMTTKELNRHIWRSPQAIKVMAKKRGLAAFQKSALYFKNGKPKYKKVKRGRWICWEWLGCLNDTGYGQCHGTFSMLAHKQVYIEEKGPIPKGHHLDHLCRNPPCVKPDHLEPVTPAVNARRGKNTKLNIQKITEIRADKVSSHASLARKFKVSPSTIHAIRNKRSWL
jgi:HNH endonuclease